MTDDSGGRTEIVRDARDLNPATASIADELSKQYYLGYPSRGKKDGRWHTIRVEAAQSRAIACARAGGTWPTTIRSKLECRVPVLATALGLSLLGSCGGLLVASTLLLFTDARAHAAGAVAGQLRGRRAARRRAARPPARSARRCSPPQAVFGTLLAGILVFFVAREAGAAPPLPHRRVPGARRDRAAACSSATRSTTSSTARSSARR